MRISGLFWRDVVKLRLSRAGWRCQRVGQAAVGPAQSGPDAEVEAVVACVELVMALAVAPSDQPAGQAREDEHAEKHVTTYVVTHSQHDHDREDHPQHGDVDRDT